MLQAVLRIDIGVYPIAIVNTHRRKQRTRMAKNQLL
jgi:hypothetical protein